MTHLILTTLVLSLLINIVMFAIAYVKQSDKLTDISYSLSFLAIALYAIFKYDSPNALSFLIFAMVVVWAVRLGGFLLYRVLSVGKDKRFDEMRGSIYRFGKFWLGQALTAWILMIPAVLVINHPKSINALVILGVIFWAIGLVTEAAADYQKFLFRSKKDKVHPWMDSGVWRYSRHPNYFGEIMIWIGLYIAAFGSLTSAERIYGLASPIFIALLLLFVSGIPILEKSADKRWGDQKAYKDYKARTSLLIPLPNKSAK